MGCRKEIIEMIEKNRKRSLVKNNIRIYKNFSKLKAEKSPVRVKRIGRRNCCPFPLLGDIGNEVL